MKKAMKKILSFVLVLALCACSTYTPVGAIANEYTSRAAGVSVWSGKADTSWYTGDKDSYDIATAEQLAGFAKLVDEAAHEDRFNGVTINLVSDIVLNDTKNFSNWGKKPPKNKWEPIGKQGGAIMGYNPFAGIFKGNGHKIIGLYSSSTDYGFWGTTSRVGFFECICGAAVTDIVFENAYVESSGAVGVVAAVSEGSYISGIKVYNSKVISKDGGAGGVIGSCHKFVNTYLISFLVLGMFGVFVNPLLYKDEAAEEILGNHGSLIADCQVKNLVIQRDKKYGDNCGSGGIVGGGTVGVYNCQVAYLTSRQPEAPGGIIVGINPKTDSNVVVKSCRYYGCKVEKPMNDKAKSFVDKASVKRIKKDTSIKVGAKKSSLTVKNVKKKSSSIALKCRSNSTSRLTYKVTSTPKGGSKYISVNGSGRVRIKKRAPKGTYVITVYSKENDRFAAAKKKISIKVKA